VNDERAWSCCPACAADAADHLFDKEGFSVVACRGCRLRYVNPRPSPRWLNEWYRRRYFDEGRIGASGGQHLAQQRMKLETARLRLGLLARFRPQGRLVDLGSGGGFFVQAAGLGGWQALGLEPSEVAARAARRNQRVKVVAGRLEQAPLATGGFEAATLFDVLEHVDAPRVCLHEVRRLLRPGGVVMIETPNMAGWVPRVMGSRHPWVRPPEHLTYFTAATLRRLLEATGFRVRHLQTGCRKILTIEYVAALLEPTNPLLARVLSGTLGRWRRLRRHPISVPMDLLLAVAEA
jgi:2-polyprenyl-3-methyl-5-hydroxy-6-metoxy-1,4-benzoquinol methylase